MPGSSGLSAPKLEMMAKPKTPTPHTISWVDWLTVVDMGQTFRMSGCNAAKFSAKSLGSMPNSSRRYESKTPQNTDEVGTRKQRAKGLAQASVMKVFGFRAYRPAVYWRLELRVAGFRV